MSDTHVVINQVPPLEEHNPASSPVLIEALIREGGQWGLDDVTAVGAISGSRQTQRWGELANRNRPILRTHDRYGHRVDEVEYDPAYHELMRVAIDHGLHAVPGRGAKVAGVGELEAALARGAHHRRGERVLRATLDRRGQACGGGHRANGADRPAISFRAGSSAPRG